MLTSLKVHNFKAIGPGPCEIGLKPLTVLVGENGSGKSSLMEGLALLAQSAVEDVDRLELVAAGSKVNLAAHDGAGTDPLDSLYFRRAVVQPLTIGVTVEAPTDGPWVGLALPMEPPEGWMTGREPWPPTRIGYSFSRTGGRWTGWEHVVTFHGEVVFRAWRRWKPKGATGAESEDGLELAGISFPKWHTLPDGVLRSALFSRERGHGVRGGVPEAHLAVLDGVWNLLLAVLKEVHLLTEVRGWPLMLTDVGPEARFVGQHGEMTLRLLSNIQAKTRSDFAALKAWAERFGLPGFECGWAGERTLAATYRDPPTGTGLGLGHSASGSRQALMLATQLLMTAPGSVLLVEEPENNLHPAYERLLPGLMADSVSSGHQVVVATHSEVFVAALGNAVRRGILSPDDVAVWHLTRDETGVRPEPIRVSDRGYLDGWVESFAAVERGLANEWYEGLPEAGHEGRGGHARPPRTRKGTKDRGGG